MYRRRKGLQQQSFPAPFCVCALAICSADSQSLAGQTDNPLILRSFAEFSKNFVKDLNFLVDISMCLLYKVSIEHISFDKSGESYG